jgi:hypothetical protein
MATGGPLRRGRSPQEQTSEACFGGCPRGRGRISARASGDVTEIFPLSTSASGSPTICETFFSPLPCSISVTLVPNLIVLREQLRDILDRRQFNIVSAMLAQWCTNVMRSKVEPMKQVATMIRTHFDGIVAWTRSRQTNRTTQATMPIRSLWSR